MSQCPRSPAKKPATGCSLFHPTASCPTCPLDATISLGNWRLVQELGIDIGSCCAACRERIDYLEFGEFLGISTPSHRGRMLREHMFGKMRPPLKELGSNIC
jgi:hypothetical protein